MRSRISYIIFTNTFIVIICFALPSGEKRTRFDIETAFDNQDVSHDETFSLKKKKLRRSHVKVRKGTELLDLPLDLIADILNRDTPQNIQHKASIRRVNRLFNKSIDLSIAKQLRELSIDPQRPASAFNKLMQAIKSSSKGLHHFSRMWHLVQDYDYRNVFNLTSYQIETLAFAAVRYDRPRLLETLNITRNQALYNKTIAQAILVQQKSILDHFGYDATYIQDDSFPVGHFIIDEPNWIEYASNYANFHRELTRSFDSTGFLDIDRLRSLLDNGTDVNTVFHHQDEFFTYRLYLPDTLLSHLCSHGSKSANYTRAVELLLERGADIQYGSPYFYQLIPIHHAFFSTFMVLARKLSLRDAGHAEELMDQMNGKINDIARFLAEHGKPVEYHHRWKEEVFGTPALEFTMNYGDPKDRRSVYPVTFYYSYFEEEMGELHQDDEDLEESFEVSLNILKLLVKYGAEIQVAGRFGFTIYYGEHDHNGNVIMTIL